MTQDHFLWCKTLCLIINGAVLYVEKLIALSAEHVFGVDVNNRLLYHSAREKQVSLRGRAKTRLHD